MNVYISTYKLTLNKSSRFLKKWEINIYSKIGYSKIFFEEFHISHVFSLK